MPNLPRATHSAASIVRVLHFLQQYHQRLLIHVVIGASTCLVMTILNMCVADRLRICMMWIRLWSRDLTLHVVLES